jgi:CRP-like cAMP-binding protein
VTGRCAVFTERDGARVVLRELGPGEVFGETSVFTGRPCTASVEAIDEVEVKVVTRESLAQSLGLHTWMGKFIQTLAERFREVDERLREAETPRP